MTSAILVIIPTRAMTHIQKTAPGPPTAMAAATPAMLPLPTVPASTVERAWKGFRVPSPVAEGLFSLPNSSPTVFFQMVLTPVNWKKPVRADR